MKIYFILTICIIILISLHYVEAENKINIKSLKAITNVNKDLARTRRRPFGLGFGFNPLMGYGFGLHALAIIYWLKVKAVIIVFIVGTALVWGAKYFWTNKSCPKQVEKAHEGSIIPFDHGPIWSGHHHHDHVPYSSSLSFLEHDPYSAYSSYSDSSPPTGPGTEHILDHSPHIHDHNPLEKKWKRKTRSTRQQQLDNENTEDQISDIMFLFLGVGSTECRKRFLCEWEYQAQRHPLTRMVFRIIGRGVFRKYARNPKDENSAKSFQDCARVHYQCTVIEEENITTQSHNNESENSIYNNVEESTPKVKDSIAKAIFSRPLNRKNH